MLHIKTGSTLDQLSSFTQVLKSEPAVIVFPSVEVRLWGLNVQGSLDYEPNKKRNVSFSLLSMCVYIHVVSATRYGETFSVERGDDEEMKIVDKWLATSSSYECTHIHTSILTGKKHVEELFHGLRVRARREFRMEKEIFYKLVEVLRDGNLLANSREISIEEQLAMFLFCLSTNASNRTIQERFQHSGETVSRYLNIVLEAIVSLSPRFIQLPSIDTPIQISSNPKFMPYFKLTTAMTLLFYFLMYCC
jgi:hypothetical protein